MLPLLSVAEFLASRPSAVWDDYVAHVDMVVAALHGAQADFPDIVNSRVWRDKKHRTIDAKTKQRNFEKRKKLLEQKQGLPQERDAIQRLAWESISQVADAVSQLAGASSQVAGAASQVAGASSQVAGGASQVAGGASQVAGAAGTLAGSLQPLVETACDIIRSPESRPSKRSRSSLLPIPDMPDRCVFVRDPSPESVASDSEPGDADDLWEWRQRMVDSLAVLKLQEVTLNVVDAAKVLRKYQKVLMDSHREEASIEIKHSEMFLAAHGCLLLTDKMPSAYHSCVTEADYRKLVAHFSQRKLPPVDLESLVSIAPVVRSMAAAVREKRRYQWLPPQLDPNTCTEEQIARQRVFCSLASSLTLNADCSEGTWVAKHILPFMPLRCSEDIDYDVDATTDYSNMRPDVFLKLGEHCAHPNRAISSWEVKTPGASAVEKAKDLARVILSCIQYLKSEHDQFVGELTLQYKLAVHFPGRQGTVYEVYLLPKMYIAVELGDVTLPVSLESCQEIPVATAIRQMEIYFERVRGLKDYMLYDTVRAAGSGGSFLPPTPDKKTKDKPRSTKVAAHAGSSGSC